MIGARLKQARAAAGLSLRDLEARVNHLVTAQAIGKYERDEMMPSSPVLLALANSLAVSATYLLEPADLTLGRLEFRKHSLTSARNEARVQALVLSALQRYRVVEDLLAIEERWGPPTGLPRAVYDLAQAESAAEELRRAWELGVDPIPNLTALMEAHQIKVFSLDLPGTVSGVHAKVDAGQSASIPVVVVNAGQAGERQRFTLAHELAHLFLTTPQGAEGERLCHRFASALLMPGQTVLRETGPRRRALSVRELFRLKAFFGVSAQAVAYRCRDLGVITESHFRSIFRTFGARGWRRQEPNPLPPEKPARYEQLVIRALAEGVVGEARAAELLGMSTWQLIEMLDSPPTSE